MTGQPAAPAPAGSSEPASYRLPAWYDEQHARENARAVRRTFPGCDRQAVREVIRAWRVTLIDPEWGRDTLLWPLLTWFLNSRTLHAA